ncbi:hypothetical protein ZWY2020_048474 [Hordeum vulgare]|nr:hypothetical protein ZWY2020_048474 [Hordeum vulgare]
MGRRRLAVLVHHEDLEDGLDAFGLAHELEKDRDALALVLLLVPARVTLNPPGMSTGVGDLGVDDVAQGEVLRLLIVKVCVIKEEIDDEPPSEKEGSEFGNVSSLENDAKMKEDVKQGIMLLENVVAKKEAHQPKSRKPLADIGNTDVKQGGAKPKQRKN